MTRRFRISILVLLVAFFTYLAYLIFAPFFAPLVWAAVFAIVFFPVYQLILRGVKRPALASLATVVVVLLRPVGSSLLSLRIARGRTSGPSTTGLTVEGLRAAYRGSVIHELASGILPIFASTSKRQLLMWLTG
jgi:hypothetical protein